MKRIVWCELDEEVVRLSKLYFARSTASSIDDPRVELHFMDAALFIKQEAADGRQFDVIIVDSSDPVGPAESLCVIKSHSNLVVLLSDFSLY